MARPLRYPPPPPPNSPRVESPSSTPGFNISPGRILLTWTRSFKGCIFYLLCSTFRRLCHAKGWRSNRKARHSAPNLVACNLPPIIKMTCRLLPYDSKDFRVFLKLSTTHNDVGIKRDFIWRCDVYDGVPSDLHKRYFCFAVNGTPDITYEVRFSWLDS